MRSTTIHPALASHYSLQGLFQRYPTINWDARRPTSTASLSSHYSSHYWNEPATSPATASLRLVCSAHPLVWHIDVYNRHGVTVGDVLDALHNALYKRLTSREWSAFGRYRRTRIWRYLTRRVTEYPQHYGYFGHSEGARRVDALLDKTRFYGLKRSYDTPHTWIVQFRHAYY